MTATPAGRGHAVQGVAFVLLAAIGFSAKAIFAKIIYRYGVDAETLLALRMLLALPFFIVLAVWSGRSTAGARLARHDWLMILTLGFMGYYLSSYLDFLGLLYISAGLERLILFLTPTMVVLFSALLFKRPIRRHHLIALALSYSGIALVFLDNLVIAHDRREIILGAALVFMSAVLYTFYMLGSGETIPRVGPARFAAYASTVACLFAILQFLLTHELTALVLPVRVYALLAALAIISTVLPVWWMAEGVRRIGASQTSMISSVGPVSTIGLGYVFLNEPITTAQIIGAALVLGGVVLVSLKAEAARPA